MFETSKPSRVFWFSIILVYIFFVSAVYSLTTVPIDAFNSDNAEQLHAAIKLSTVRLVGMAIVLIGYPLVLLRYMNMPRT